LRGSAIFAVLSAFKAIRFIENYKNNCGVAGGVFYLGMEKELFAMFTLRLKKSAKIKVFADVTIRKCGELKWGEFTPPFFTCANGTNYLRYKAVVLQIAIQ
jgi:hypothetical protein